VRLMTSLEPNLTFRNLVQVKLTAAKLDAASFPVAVTAAER